MCEGLNPDKIVIVNLQPSFLNREIEQVKNLGFSVINEFDKMADIQAVLELISMTFSQ